MAHLPQRPGDVHFQAGEAMTDAAHHCLYFSEGYGLVGTMAPCNRYQITMLRCPEYGAISTRVHPRAMLTNQETTR